MFDETRRTLRLAQIINQRSLRLSNPLQELVQVEDAQSGVFMKSAITAKTMKLNVDQFANLSQT